MGYIARKMVNLRCHLVHTDKKPRTKTGTRVEGILSQVARLNAPVCDPDHRSRQIRRCSSAKLMQ